MRTSDSDDRRTVELPEYKVSVSNTFAAQNAEDAVRQMIEWIIDNAPHTGYRVHNHEGHFLGFYDGNDCT